MSLRRASAPPSSRRPLRYSWWVHVRSHPQKVLPVDWGLWVHRFAVFEQASESLEAPLMMTYYKEDGVKRAVKSLWPLKGSDFEVVSSGSRRFLKDVTDDRNKKTPCAAILFDEVYSVGQDPCAPAFKGLSSRL